MHVMGKKKVITGEVMS